MWKAGWIEEPIVGKERYLSRGSRIIFSFFNALWFRERMAKRDLQICGFLSSNEAHRTHQWASAVESLTRIKKTAPFLSVDTSRDKTFFLCVVWLSQSRITRCSQQVLLVLPLCKGSQEKQPITIHTKPQSRLDGVKWKGKRKNTIGFFRPPYELLMTANECFNAIKWERV